MKEKKKKKIVLKGYRILKTEEYQGTSGKMVWKVL